MPYSLEERQRYYFNVVHAHYKVYPRASRVVMEFFGFTQRELALLLANAGWNEWYFYKTMVTDAVVLFVKKESVSSEDLFRKFSGHSELKGYFFWKQVLTSLSKAVTMEE